jgi:tRNA-splicing endonuclease subunit Sen54
MPCGKITETVNSTVHLNMADLDEDAPITSLPSNTEDDDPTDEIADYRLLSTLSAKSGQLPKRGEKDFEPHGTRHQDGILESSRQAMHDALSHTRFHTAKNHTRGFYYGEESLKRDDVVPPEWRKGLEDDHVVVLESTRGPHWKTMGKSTLGQRYASVWLLPEEALYLVERGNLDLWWPSRSSFKGMVTKKVDGENLEIFDMEKKDVDEGVPMSLQAAYAFLIGRDEQKGKVSLDRYTVYTNLRRNGYAVLRAPERHATMAGEIQKTQHVPNSTENLFIWLFGRFFSSNPPPFGPLVRPGMYKSYNTIYQQIAIISRYQPSQNNPVTSPEDPYRVVFYIWKPDNVANFIKTNPGDPDFRIAITDARSSFVPSLTQMTSLLQSTPWDPPKPEWAKLPEKLYQRLRHGWRNVVLAVVDQGVISYLRLGETAFGEEDLSKRFDQNVSGGGKRGGGASRGGRGGRGRGRGRGK